MYRPSLLPFSWLVVPLGVTAECVLGWLWPPLLSAITKNILLCDMACFPCNIIIANIQNIKSGHIQIQPIKYLLYVKITCRHDMYG